MLISTRRCVKRKTPCVTAIKDQQRAVLEKFRMADLSCQIVDRPAEH